MFSRVNVVPCDTNYHRFYSSVKKLVDFLNVSITNKSSLANQQQKKFGSRSLRLSSNLNNFIEHVLTGENHSSFKISSDTSIGQLYFGCHCRFYSSVKKHLDYSNVPTLNEDDLEEQFVKGSGPGGQKINKTSSCVVLKHIPSGLVVKCQESRLLDYNRKKARIILTTKLDNFLNNENSLAAQTKYLLDKKKIANEKKKEKMRTLKAAWKQNENMT